MISYNKLMLFICLWINIIQI